MRGLYLNSDDTIRNYKIWLNGLRFTLEKLGAKPIVQYLRSVLCPQNTRLFKTDGPQQSGHDDPELRFRSESEYPGFTLSDILKPSPSKIIIIPAGPSQGI